MHGGAALRVVQSSEQTAECTNVIFEEVSARAQARRGLRVEATTLETWYGPNAYSQFLLKHGRRPDRAEAAVIGRLIGAVLLRMSDTDSGAQSRAVVDQYRKEYPHLIERGSKDLEDATLMQMVSSLKRRKPPRSILPIRDLFADLDQVVVVRVVEEDGRVIKKNKTPRKLTLHEAENYLAEHRQERERNDREIERLQALIDEARPYILHGGTLEDGIAAAEAEKASKGKKT